MRWKAQKNSIDYTPGGWINFYTINQEANGASIAEHKAFVFLFRVVGGVVF